MWIFNKDNLSNLYSINPELIDCFNETIKKYSPKRQKEYFELITLIDGDYDKLFKIPYVNYLYELSKEPYSNLDVLKHYHNAMLSINETNNYSDLYHILKDNRDVENFIDNYMLENDIYLSAELYSIVDSDLKRNGMKSNHLPLANKIENNIATYSKINDYWNGIELYYDTVEIFKEVYESNSDVIDKYYFNELELEPDFDMDEETDNNELSI